MIERLNQTFSLPNALAFVRDKNNFVKAILTSPARESAELLLHGGHLTSWISAHGNELLFMGTKAIFERGKAIRGGIPLIFPQFGKGELPSHGFARTSMWDVKETNLLPSGEPHIVLKLDDGPLTQKIWPHPFSLELSVSLGQKLSMSLKVVNCGLTPFFFYAGFHNYFRVSDARRIEVHGLKDITYMDALKNRSYGVENAEAITPSGQTDRIFINAPDTVRIVDTLAQREVTVVKKNIRDMVVWNPWADGSKAISDLAPSEFESFVCVEPAIVNQKITINPREKYEIGQELSYR
jgi:glucose-6-phosphate 1-epimerase